jgi:hypothetical protein
VNTKNKKHALQEAQPRLSKEDLLKKIEERLVDPSIGARELASLSKRWANLTGAVKQGEYVRTSQPRPEPEPETEPNFPVRMVKGQVVEFWRIYLVEIIAGFPNDRWGQALLKKFKALSAEEQAVIRAEAEEHKAMCARIRAEQDAKHERLDLLEKLSKHGVAAPAPSQPASRRAMFEK